MSTLSLQFNLHTPEGIEGRYDPDTQACICELARDVGPNEEVLSFEVVAPEGIHVGYRPINSGFVFHEVNAEGGLGAYIPNAEWAFQEANAEGIQGGYVPAGWGLPFAIALPAGVELTFDLGQSRLSFQTEAAVGGEGSAYPAGSSLSFALLTPADLAPAAGAEGVSFSVSTPESPAPRPDGAGDSNGFGAGSDAEA
ncbi:hypothetical protein [Pseudomonas sp. NPDC007930]|uniref:hypothetical protein n=1 Tax=Pseudomonas sp. NPDC007930 TaxID=3364417 RepID=UPI0036E8DF48